MSTETTTVETVERWTYLGRRYRPGVGIVHAWERADGREAVFKKFPGTVGGVYDITVVDGDKVRGNPKWTGDSVGTDRHAILTAADRDAYATKATVDAEKRLGKSDRLDRAIEPLERLAAGCRTVEELEALQGIVRSRLVKARWNS
jgi:hypothetical protein